MRIDPQLRVEDRCRTELLYFSPELGHVNCRSGGEIKIANLEVGQEITEASERPVSLTCACFDHRICHRAIIVNHLRAEGFTVEELMDVEE